ncbi:MAG: hypothetical protein Q7S53_01610 [bacterium]|nr:hypothetical protein [bacterium]
MERELEIVRPVYIIDTDKEADEGENTEYFKPYSRTKQIFYSLPEGSTLYLGMSNVQYVDWFFALMTVGEIQNAKAAGTHSSTVYRKHLVVKEPRRLVLKEITKMVDDYSNCFLHLDQGGALSVSGRKVTKSKSKLLLIDRLLSGGIENVSAGNVRESIFPNRSEQAVSYILRELAYCGVLIEKNEKYGQGRPLKLYSPYWPSHAKSWEIGGEIYKRADA